MNEWVITLRNIKSSYGTWEDDDDDDVDDDDADDADDDSV
jgi:hypothetical protein